MREHCLSPLLPLGYYHAIILDVDSKDPSTGLSSPPPSFVNGAFLAAVRTLLHDDGECSQLLGHYSDGECSQLLGHYCMMTVSVGNC